MIIKNKIAPNDAVTIRKKQILVVKDRYNKSHNGNTDVNNSLNLEIQIAPATLINSFRSISQKKTPNKLVQIANHKPSLNPLLKKSRTGGNYNSNSSNQKKQNNGNLLNLSNINLNSSTIIPSHARMDSGIIVKFSRKKRNNISYPDHTIYMKKLRDQLKKIPALLSKTPDLKNTESPLSMRNTIMQKTQNGIRNILMKPKQDMNGIDPKIRIRRSHHIFHMEEIKKRHSETMSLRAKRANLISDLLGKTSDYYENEYESEYDKNNGSAIPLNKVPIKIVSISMCDNYNGMHKWSDYSDLSKKSDHKKNLSLALKLNNGNGQMTMNAGFMPTSKAIVKERIILKRLHSQDQSNIPIISAHKNFPEANLRNSPPFIKNKAKLYPRTTLYSAKKVQNYTSICLKNQNNSEAFQMPNKGTFEEESRENDLTQYQFKIDIKKKESRTMNLQPKITEHSDNSEGYEIYNNILTEYNFL